MKYKDKIITSNNIEELISCYGDKEFSSPYRSTIPLIELFFKNKNVLEKIIPNIQEYETVFEYETKVQKGKGKASCTDLMIFNDNYGFCIEAKRTEPAYKTVKEWLELGNRENRNLVLTGWLELINKRCITRLKINDIENCPYQMIHRFASACNIATNSEMLYFCFETDNSFYYEKELEKLSELVNKKLPIKLVNFKITESENFKKLEDNCMLRSGNLDLSDEVQQLIIEEKIMNIEIEKIREF